MLTQENNFVNEFYKSDVDALKQFETHKKFASNIQNTLAEIYANTDKGARIEQCGNSLVFERFHNDEHTTTLNSANFCKHKLCPYCAWRWHKRNANILDKSFEILQNQNFYHLVLTIPNVNFLTKEFLITLRQNATKFVKQVMKSKDYFMSFEITVDKNGKFHPHYHIIIILNNVPTKKEIQTEWAKYSNCGNNYAICDIKPCTDKKISFELTKYIIKFDNETLDKKSLYIIEKATKGIRKFATSGKIKIAEEKAKNLIQQEAFNKMQELKIYDSDLLFYEWFSKSYQLKEIINIDRHKQNRAN